MAANRSAQGSALKTQLMLHHSWTKDTGTLSAQAIRRYHMEVNGWRDIGYHLLIELVGDRYEMLVGRPLTSSAAAAREQRMNHKAIHCCFVGNFDGASPNETMWNFGLMHLGSLCDLAGITIDREHILGHREVAPYKSCPGKMFNLDRFVQQLQGQG